MKKFIALTYSLFICFAFAVLNILSLGSLAACDIAVYLQSTEEEVTKTNTQVYIYLSGTIRYASRCMTNDLMHNTDTFVMMWYTAIQTLFFSTTM